MNARTEALISVWSGPFLSRHGVIKLRSVRAWFRTAVGKIYALGILAYFGAAGIQAISIPYLSEWLPYMGRHAAYALAWPIVVPIEIRSGRGPSSPRQWLRLMTAESGGRQLEFVVRR